MDAARNEKQGIERLAFRPHEVAKAIGSSRAYAYELVKAGVIRSVRSGRAIFVPREAIEEFLAGRNGGAADEAGA